MVNLPLNVCLRVWVSSITCRPKEKKIVCEGLNLPVETRNMFSSCLHLGNLTMDVYTDGIYGIGSLCSIATVTLLKHHVSCLSSQYEAEHLSPSVPQTGPAHTLARQSARYGWLATCRHVQYVLSQKTERFQMAGPHQADVHWLHSNGLPCSGSAAVT